MRKSSIFFYVMFLAMFIAVPSYAGLVHNGGGLTYDTDLNITWYDHTFGPMPYEEAVATVGTLDIGGVKGWRLPKVNPHCALFYIDYPAIDLPPSSLSEEQQVQVGWAMKEYLGNRAKIFISAPDTIMELIKADEHWEFIEYENPCGWSSTRGEMFHIYYDELHNTYGPGNFTNAGPFTQLLPYSDICYWSEYPSMPDIAPGFQFFDGVSDSYLKQYGQHWLAVHDGNVCVPIPGAIFLLAPGLAILVAIRRG